MFHNIVFSVETNIPSKKKKEIKETIEAHGGVVSDFVTRKVSFNHFLFVLLLPLRLLLFLISHRLASF